jgi:hypothetical protein
MAIRGCSLAFLNALLGQEGATHPGSPRRTLAINQAFTWSWAISFQRIWVVVTNSSTSTMQKNG